MAIYHYSVQMIQRSKGQSAVAAAAYRAGAVLHDQRLGQTHDYSRKRSVSFTAILAPPEAPTWVYEREQLWNRVEAVEKQCNAQVAREVNLALPQELTPEQNQNLLRQFVMAQFVEHGMIADVVVHDLDHNPHAHLLLTTRPLEGGEFGLKNRDWNQKAFLEEQRKNWAEHTNRALEQAGFTARIDHRSLQDQGVERMPQIHLGASVTAMKQKAERKGEVLDSPRWERYQEIEQLNQKLRVLHQAIEEEEQRLQAVWGDLAPISPPGSNGPQIESSVPEEVVAASVVNPQQPISPPGSSGATIGSPVPEKSVVPAAASEPIPAVAIEQLQEQAEQFAPVLARELEKRQVRKIEGENAELELSGSVLTYRRKADGAVILKAQWTGKQWQALPSQGLPPEYRQVLEQAQKQMGTVKDKRQRPKKQRSAGMDIGD